MTAAPPAVRPTASPAWVGDLTGGVTSAVVALPLALAFAVASGVPAQAGLYTAIVAGIVAALVGGAPLQITGPTGAMAVILVGLVAQHGLAGIWIAGLMAGLLQVALGVLRLGGLAALLPMPVVTGFTAGIGVIILLGQLGNAVGVALPAAHGGPVRQLPELAGRLGATNPAALGLTLGVLLVMAVWPRLNRTIPGSLVALVAATGAAVGLGLDVPRIGAIPQGLPVPALPPFDPAKLGGLVQPAIALAALGAIESLLSAAVADRLAGTPPHDPNRELIGQGLANLAVPFFGGIPATGAIARTAVNIRAGARTRFSGVVHGLAIALVLVVLGPLAAQIPLAALAGILVAVSFRMIEWELIRRVWRATRSDFAVLALTFGTTVAFDLVLAVEVGLAAAALLFIRRMADLHLTMRPAPGLDAALPEPLRGAVAVYDLDRPLFFADAHRFAEALQAEPGRRAVILRLDATTTLDVTAAQALEDVLATLRRRGTLAVLCGLAPEALALLDRLGIAAPSEAVVRCPDVATAATIVAGRLAGGEQAAA